MGGDDNDRHLLLAINRFGSIDAVAGGEADIGEDQIGPVHARLFNEFVMRPRDANGLAADQFKLFAKGIGKRVVIFGDGDTKGGGLHCVHTSTSLSIWATHLCMIPDSRCECHRNYVSGFFDG